MRILYNEIKRIFHHHYIGLIIMLVISIIIMTSYNIVYANRDTINQSIQNVDNNILNIFDINKDLFTSVDGYYIFTIKILEIIYSIYAIILGSRIASYDLFKNTKDYLYTKPLKRDRIMINRIISSSIILFIQSLLVLILSSILFNIFNKHYDFYILLLSNLSLFIISLIFYSIGLVVGGLSKRYKNIISISVVIVFIIIHILDIYFNLKVLYYLNPFSFFNTNTILTTNTYPYQALLISLFYLVFFMSFGINIYNSNVNEKSD